MKKILVLLCMSLFLFSACSDDDKKEINTLLGKIEKPESGSFVVSQGNSFQLKYIPDKDSNIKDSDVTWTSSNPSVATVSPKGIVTTIAPGETTVSMLVNGVSVDNCKVQVGDQAITDISLDATAKQVQVGHHFRLRATITPVGISDHTLFWSSSNESVATVDNNGNVRGISPGNATIKVSAANSSINATCLVTVVGQAQGTVAVTGITDVVPQVLELRVGYERHINQTYSAVKVLPENASNRQIVFTSSDPSIVLINNGVIKALKAGEVRITAKTEEGGFEKSGIIKVTEHNESIYIYDVKTDYDAANGGWLITSYLMNNTSNTIYLTEYGVEGANPVFVVPAAQQEMYKVAPSSYFKMQQEFFSVADRAQLYWKYKVGDQYHTTRYRLENIVQH